MKSGRSNVSLITSRRTFASSPRLLSLDQQIQPREKERIPGEHAVEKQGTIVTSKCEGKGMEGMERVGEGSKGVKKY